MKRIYEKDSGVELRLLYSAKRIDAEVQRLAQEISSDYAGQELVSVIYDPAALAAARESFAAELTAAEQRAFERDIISCDKADLFLDADSLTRLLSEGRCLEIPFLDVDGPGDVGEKISFKSAENSDLKLDISTDSEGVLRPLVEKLLAWQAANNRVLLVYGYRHPPYGIRARVLDPECTGVASAPEVVLRDDGGNGDLGYPWATMISEREALVVYYFNRNDGTRFIAGTIVGLTGP